MTGFGDLAPGNNGGLGMVAYPVLLRLAETVLGVALYAWLIAVAIRTLGAMLGAGEAARPARRRISHGYYLVAGAAAVLVGLANPLGVVIVLMSATASSFGGLAGFISVGFAGTTGEPKPFDIAARWPILAAGVAGVTAFALILGPTLHP